MHSNVPLQITRKIVNHTEYHFPGNEVDQAKITILRSRNDDTVAPMNDTPDILERVRAVDRIRGTNIDHPLRHEITPLVYID